jgi:glyoxylase-like metal-dependent hydrolase (beta-lactamase superfamily II)
MQRHIFFPALLVASMMLTPVIAASDSKSRLDEPTDSNERANASLDLALQTLGGTARLKSLNEIYITGAGYEFRSAEVQGLHPDKETKQPHEEKMAISISEGKTSYEIRTRRHDLSWRWRRQMFFKDRRAFVDFIAKSAGSSPAPSAMAEQLGYRRRVPHLLLLEAAENRASLRWTGEAIYEGRKHDVISCTLPGMDQPLSLFIDSEKHLLSKFEYAIAFPSLGDTTIELAYPSYKSNSDLIMFPAGHHMKIAGKMLLDVSYTTVTTNPSQVASLFEIPEELRSLIVTPGTVTEIARGVFLVENLNSYTPMFIEFKDFVLAVEAPARHPFVETVPPRNYAPASDLSEVFINKIKEKIPSKPIRYLTVTHYHSDHAGGARAFVAEGSTIVTTPGNKRFFESMASASLNVAPDRLSKNPRPLTIETFDKKHVITDGERVVELINVGANPHTEEMIVVYLPKEKFIYQGDLFYYSDYESFPTRTRVGIMRFFARWLKANRITPERIYGFHDTGYSTMEQVNQILRYNLD